MDLLEESWPHKAINQEGPIAYVRRAVAEALGTVQQSAVLYRVDVVPNIKVTGGGGIVDLSIMVDSSIGLLGSRERSTYL